MGECNSHGNCSKSSCSCCGHYHICCGHGAHEEHDEEDCCSPDAFIEAADEAWMEILKDKMKEYLLSTHGDKLAELAKLITDANNKRWKNKMEKKQGCADFGEQLCRFFGKK